MTKIYLVNTSVKNYLNNNLTNAINLLKQATSTASVLDVPYDFDYRDYTKNIEDNLTSELNQLKTVYNKIKNGLDGYNGINNDVNDKLGDIENYSISLRKSAIR